MDLTTIPIDKPTDVNFILGQSHFIREKRQVSGPPFDSEDYEISSVVSP